MDKSRQGSRAYKTAIVLAPLLLLIMAIAVNQFYLIPAEVDPPPGQNLQLLGYGVNGSTLTLQNTGNSNLTILNVAYDGRLLTRGVLGGTTPMFSMGGSPLMCYASTDDLVFPQGEHWNMDTEGLCTPTILPGEVATLYLGVFSPKPEQHVVVIHTQAGDFVFTLAPSQ